MNEQERRVREELEKLDGTDAAAVSSLTGYSHAELDDLGGIEEQEIDEAELVSVGRSGDTMRVHLLVDGKLVRGEFSVEVLRDIIEPGDLADPEETP